jgi:hypothetical protein
MARPLQTCERAPGGGGAAGLCACPKLPGASPTHSTTPATRLHRRIPSPGGRKTLSRFATYTAALTFEAMPRHISVIFTDNVTGVLANVTMNMP